MRIFLQTMFYKFLKLHQEKEPEDFYGLKEIAGEFIDNSIKAKNKEASYCVRLIKELS